MCSVFRPAAGEELKADGLRSWMSFILSSEETDLISGFIQHEEQLDFTLRDLGCSLCRPGDLQTLL